MWRNRGLAYKWVQQVSTGTMQHKPSQWQFSPRMLPMFPGHFLCLIDQAYVNNKDIKGQIVDYPANITWQKLD